MEKASSQCRGQRKSAPGIAALALLLCSTAARAGGQATAPVARLSLLDGEVHVATAGYHAEAIDAALNMGLTAGQVVQTSAHADAEVEFPDGSILRSYASSNATLIRLQPQTEIGLDDGLYYLELRAGDGPQFAVYAGDLSISPVENASFRVRVQSGQPEIAVLRGVVSVTRASSYTVDLRPGESLRTDAKDNRRYLLADTIAQEAGDSWNERRAQQTADAAATQTIAREDYASDQGYGWSDLDSSGSWYPLPGEGLVWQPAGVDASFDPYGYGAWVPGSAGYVWASGYSWGWLPYHCGSWGFFAGLGWGWQPAVGCRSYGGSSPVNGLPVKNPPHGWRGPQPPKLPVNGGIIVRHPTLPVGAARAAARVIAADSRASQPIQLNGITLRPLMPVVPAPTPHGSSAVGSALRRDFPVQSGTHLPAFGREQNGPAVLPGRPPEWHSPTASAARADEPGRNMAPTDAPAGEIPSAESAGVVSRSALQNRTAFGGWHSRVLQDAPPTGLSATPAAAGIIVARPGIRVPGAVPSVPGNSNPVPVLPQPVRVPVTSPIRVVTPQHVAPAPQFTPPSPRINVSPPPRVNLPPAPPRVNLPPAPPRTGAPAPVTVRPR